MHAQFWDSLFNPEVEVTLTHPPGLGIKVQRVAFAPVNSPMAEDLVSACIADLANSGQIEVVDRGNIEKVLNEQKFSNGGLAVAMARDQVHKMLLSWTEQRERREAILPAVQPRHSGGPPMSQHPVKDPVSWLYPPIEPFRTGRLKVSDVHELYYEESGNPGGKPVVFLHGGPGGGTDPKQRRFFHPDKYRIVLFDQRGCGKSTPHACLEANTTWDLVDDTERLREHLGIKRWQVFGGSWGSTLALAYAEAHPEAVTEMVLRGIFLLRRQEIDWFYQRGAGALYPDAWEGFLAAIPEAERGDLLTAYHRRLTGPDPAARLAAARAWSRWEGATSKLLPDPEFTSQHEEEAFALAFASIECHYFFNRGWFDPDDQLLRNAARIRHLPGVIVQGRYDVICPMESAWALHRAWPEADFIISPDAGHSAFEPANSRALVAAADRFAG